MPGRIAAVTIATPDLAGSVAAYCDYLGYEVLTREPVQAAVARQWGVPTLAGRAAALLGPGGAHDSVLRFVESPVASGYTPFRHVGWNAAEHVVQDCDAAALKLADSPFRIIGPPADLSFTDRIRALQAVGPSNEVLYLTQVKGPVPGFDLPTARHFVDRVFIMILGGADLEALLEFYHAHFGTPKPAAMDTVISVISAAYGQPLATKHKLSAVPIGHQSYIEADQMPAAVTPRPQLPGDLPPAISMVSFEVPALPASLPWVATPTALTGAPYSGRRAGGLHGAAAEWIELIEQP